MLLTEVTVSSCRKDGKALFEIVEFGAETGPAWWGRVGSMIRFLAERLGTRAHKGSHKGIRGLTPWVDKTDLLNYVTACESEF